MTTVPSNLVPTRISQLTEYDGLSQDGYLPYVLNGVTYKVRFGNIASVGAVPSSRTITGGGGLTGGGDLTADRVISIAAGGVGYSQLADSGVVAGTYGSASEIPVLQIDAKGRVEVASTTPIDLTNYVPTSRSITAGDGLTGGGTLAANRTISLVLSAATPQSGGVPAAGTSTTAARDDHVHPAVDLSDTTETTGVLPLGRGGTGGSLSPVAGALMYCTGTEMAFMQTGTAGQVLLSGGTGEPTWGTISGTGTVTSVNVSGGTTGFTFSGGPITGAGTITMSGALSTTSGGTGVFSYTAGDMLYYASSTALSKLAIGANTYLMVSNGTSPVWQDPATVTVGAATTATTATSATTATTATNIAGGAAGSIPYQTGAGATALLAAGSGVLVGGSTPSYSTTPTLTGTNFTGIPNGALSNSSITIGTTAVSLGGTSLTLGGLTSVAVTQDPVSALQLATKQYVDTLLASGITYHQAVKYEVPNSTGNLTATYNNGTAGVGATLTNAGTLGAFTPDGVVALVGDRILVYNQTNQFENGVYEVTTVGDGSTPWVLTRTTDADSYGLKDPNALGEGDAFFITSGNTGAGETYVCNTSGTITFGTTAITFTQVSFTQVYSAGTGLTLTGTQFSLTSPVATTLGGTGLTTFNANGAVYATSSSALTTGTLPTASGGTGLTSFTSDGAVYATSTSALTTGTLPVTAGGTGAATLTANNVLLGNGTSALQVVAPGTNGNVLTSNGTTWVSQAPAASGVSQARATALSLVFGL